MPVFAVAAGADCSRAGFAVEAGALWYVPAGALAEPPCHSLTPLCPRKRPSCLHRSNTFRHCKRPVVPAGARAGACWAPTCVTSQLVATRKDKISLFVFTSEGHYHPAASRNTSHCQVRYAHSLPRERDSAPPDAHNVTAAVAVGLVLRWQPRLA